MPISVASLECGLGQNLVHLLVDGATRAAAVVDPAFEGDRILKWAEGLGARIEHVLVTHTHVDHVEAVGEVGRKTGARVHVHTLEAAFLPADVDAASVRAHDGKGQLALGASTVELLHTPGHTPGGTTYLCEGYAATGDVLFVRGCGRADLRGGDVEALFASLYGVLLELPGDTIVLPGHDYGPRPRSTLWEEARDNPFLKFRGDPAGFKRFRMPR